MFLFDRGCFINPMLTLIYTIDVLYLHTHYVHDTRIEAQHVRCRHMLRRTWCLQRAYRQQGSLGQLDELVTVSE